MKALSAISKQTVRAAVRSKVFLVIFLLNLAAIFILPATVQSDGTPVGEIRLALNYSLGVVTALVSASTLWLACSILPKEIESYRMHMVFVKPTPRWLVWVGKWLGVFIMQAGIYLVSALIIYLQIEWKVRHSDYSENDLKNLRNEVLVGRRFYNPYQPDFDKLASERYKQLLAEGRLEEGHDPAGVRQEVKKMLKSQSTEVPFGAGRPWYYENVRELESGEMLYCRYRVYVGSTSDSGQRITHGLWLAGVVDEEGNQMLAPLYEHTTRSGVVHQFGFDSSFVNKENSLMLYFQNRDQGQNSQIFQIKDGPFLLVPEAGFFENYFRAVCLVLLQIAFLAALGCTAGAAFSTPVAIFTGIAYIIIGMSVQGAVTSVYKNDFGEWDYKNTMQAVNHKVSLAVNYAVVAAEDFDATGDLSKGKLVDNARIGMSLLKFTSRGAILAFLGMWVLSRRELGTVIRK